MDVEIRMYLKKQIANNILYFESLFFIQQEIKYWIRTTPDMRCLSTQSGYIYHGSNEKKKKKILLRCGH